ncbi:MAG: sigma-54-dependent Fis family transcriptional regulator [Planctomycetes bacterium]|nr:sigma-54-dependent Fis family transcriptional regulator [Planctomycetota bacterium]
MPSLWGVCAYGYGEHLAVAIPGPESPLGWIVSDALDRTSVGPERGKFAERLLAVAVQEMLSFLAEHRGPDRSPAPPLPLRELIGDSQLMTRTRGEIRLALDTPFPVLLLGETGTGKDLAARLLHVHSARRSGPFLPLNCAALTETLADSQLFGHVRGSFSGADRDHPGLFLDARGGTLFLDEVQELSPAIQAKLLRAIESGEVLPVGGTRIERSDARVLAASNTDLEAAVRARRFRGDLFYRLHVLTVHFPPLRERRGDVAALVRHALDATCRRLSLPPRSPSREALAVLMAAPWPGNVRQLFHEIERAVVRSDGPELRQEHLSPELWMPALHPKLTFLEMGRRLLDEWERGELARGLEATGWNVAGLGRALGVSKRALFTRIARHGLSREASRTAEPD